MGGTTTRDLPKPDLSTIKSKLFKIKYCYHHHHNLCCCCNYDSCFYFYDYSYCCYYYFCYYCYHHITISIITTSITSAFFIYNTTTAIPTWACVHDSCVIIKLKAICPWWSSHCEAVSWKLFRYVFNSYQYKPDCWTRSNYSLKAVLWPSQMTDFYMQYCVSIQYSISVSSVYGHFQSEAQKETFPCLQHHLCHRHLLHYLLLLRLPHQWLHTQASQSEEAQCLIVLTQLTTWLWDSWECMSTGSSVTGAMCVQSFCGENGIKWLHTCIHSLR